MKKILTTNILTILLLLSLGNCKEQKKLLGAGATFPYPLYSKMFAAYYKSTGVKINYQAIGSGGGIRQIKNKTVDFGASDAFLSNKALAKIDKSLLHIPMALGAVAVSYNLADVSNLKINQSVLSNIFLGSITSWNDKSIQKLNPKVKLPNLKITVVHRSDGSGTTKIFTDFLSKISKNWKTKVGKGKAVSWPMGLGAKGNAGVAGMIKNTKGAIGYIEISYAIVNKMSVAAIKNQSGNYIVPNLKSTSLAAMQFIPNDTRVSITNTKSKMGYPIAGFTWILVYKEQAYNNRKLENVKLLVTLLSWMIHEGQNFHENLYYSKLPKTAIQKAKTIINSITFNNKRI